MKILVFGSLNIDHDYHVDHICQPKETMTVTDYETAAGGKGLNQSIAIAKTGSEVWLAGVMGTGSEMLQQVLDEYHVNTSLLDHQDLPNGHAIIQIDKTGQNSIFVYPGSNYAITREYADEVLSHFSAGDYLVLQNEISLQDYIIEQGHSRGLTILMNPSPCDDSLKAQPLELVDYFFINEVEGELLTGYSDPEKILEGMLERYPASHIILTLGENGSCYGDHSQTVWQQAVKAKAIDTVGAGDTFMGYFIYGLSQNTAIADCLLLAARASSITVSRKGAAASIPTIEEVMKLA